MDANINAWSTSVQSAPFTEMAKIIHYSFDTTPALVTALIVAAYLFYKKYNYEALLLMGSLAGNIVLTEIVKTLVHSPRPLDAILTTQGFSFPSGHVTNTVVLFGLLTYFAWHHWQSAILRILLSMLSVIVAIVVGLDRIYLNVHWFGDNCYDNG